MRVRTLSRAQILQEFHLHCQSLAANDNRGYKQQYEELNDVGKEFTSSSGELEANREKNRYPFIVPYDHCRVRLSLQDSQPYSDYINANFVPGGESERDFICTQGPLHNTMADFWRMVWEQNVRIIVMVTALRHKDLIMCEPYWPLERGSAWYGLVQVTTLARKQGPDYFITTINLRQRGCPTERIITHYYYPAWPDRGVPKKPSSLCTLAEHVRKHLEAIPRLGPAVVHCSAGVGRSGTFVTLLWLMQLCARGIKPDIQAAVEDLRKHRMWMVQNLEQYIFVHLCLLHWLSKGLGGPVPGPRASVPPPRASQRRPRPSSSETRGEAVRRGRPHGPNQPGPAVSQNSLQQLFLQPGKLLRRFMPSSVQTNTRSHT